MSQTQRTSHDHQMYIFNSKFIVRAVRIMLPAAIVLAMVWPASAAAITWNHTSGTLYWDNTANWSPSTAVPGSGDDVTFGNTGAVVLTTPPTVTNEVRSDITINSLVYAPTLNVQTTKVDPSVLLKIKGAVAAPSTADGNVSLWACAAAAGADDVSQSLFTGGGLMDISTSTGGNTGGDIVVRQTNGTAGLHNSILDLSGLTSFNANVDQLLIAYATSSVDRPNGTLYLAQNNTITLNNTGTITSSTSADGGLIVGFAGNHATGQPANLYLGQTNTINVQNAYIAGRRQIANMLFAPIYSSTSPTLKMRGIDGTSRVTLISIGDNTGNGTGSTNVATGTMDLTGGIADIMATSIILGTSNASSTSHSQGGRGTLTFNAGTIDTTSMILGNETANLNMTSASDGDYGAVNVNGTAHLIVGSGGIVLGSYFGGGNGVVTGTLNIRNTATVTVNGTIQAGGVPVSSIAGSYSNISMSGGTLDMTGHAIGSTGPINVFTVSGGSIVNLASLTVNTFKVNSNYSLTSGPLTLNNGGAVDMRNGAANTFTVNNLTLQATPSLYFELSNSLSSGNDQMTVGTLNLGSGSTTTIKISPLSSSFASGRYNLINYTSETGSTTWGVSNTTRNTMSNPQDDTTNKQIYLNISPASAHDLTWSGGTNTSSAPGIWDWNTTANWTSSSGSDKYYDLDTVTFTTNAGGASFIKLQNTFPGATAAGVGFIPGSVTVNSDSDYTFTANTQGSDRISGSTTLYKDGTGTLTMSVSNDYTGATTIHAGTIVLGNAAGLGTGSLTIQNGGTLDLHRLSLGGKAITVTGAGVGGLGAIVNNSTSTPDATQNDVSNVTLSGDTTFGGLATIVTNSSGVNTGLPASQVGRWEFFNAGGTCSLTGNGHTLTKTGNNEVIFINFTADSTTENVVINEGILDLERASSFGDPAGTITVNGAGAGQPAGGSILQMNDLTTPLNKNIQLQNNGQLYVMQNSGDSAGGDTVIGSIAVADSGGILNAGGTRADSAANSNARMFITGAITNAPGGSSAAVLTKTGPGTVTLSGSNSFSGTIAVNDGTLNISNYLKGGITLATSTSTGITTTLTGTATIGGTVTDASGVIIAPGATSAAGSVGTFTFGGLSLTGGGQINYDLSNDPSVGSDLININGNLSLAGTTNIAIPNISSLASGSYRLMNYTGSLTGGGSLALLNIPPNTRRNFTITYVTNPSPTPNQVNFSLTGSIASLVWKGPGGNSNWDVVTTPNWQNGAVADMFYNLDNVTFDDSSTNQSVVLYADVSPGQITVNSTKDYTISGQQKITGTAGLTKSGTGKLILANGSSTASNDFSGPIVINAGTLQVGDGQSSFVTIGTGAITNNSQLVFNQTENHTCANVISGTGSLEQKGSAVLTLSGANTYDGVTTITAGTLQAGSSTALGSTVGGTTIANGATLDVNNQALGDEVVTVQGAGVGGNGAIINSNTASSTTAQNALRFVVLTGNTTFGGTANDNGTGPSANSGRWEIRGVPTELATINTNGQPYNITKVGNNQVSFVRLTADSALADINIGSNLTGTPGGILDLIANTSLGDPTKSINVAASSTLQLEGLTTPLAKNIKLDGGNLYALAISTPGATDNTILGTVTITDASGNTINTGGVRNNDVTAASAGVGIIISGVVTGSSAATLTKLGPGTLTLTNSNTFSGTVNHNDGTLIITGTLDGNIVMGSSSSTTGTVLSGTGKINGAVSDNYITNIAPGATAAAGSVGTLTIGAGGLTLGSNGTGKITMDLSNNPSSGNDLINVTGPLNASGYTNVSYNVTSGYLLGSPTGTHYQLIHYGSMPTGDATNFVLPVISSRQSYSIFKNTTTNTIDLVVTGAVGNLTWVGALNSNAWDVQTTTNWSGAVDQLFYNTDQVTFDNSSANLTVNIAPTAVMPGSITVNCNSSHNYVFAGTGSITGGTSLTKSGSGSLTINTSNAYTGPTSITGGTIILGVASALGSATSPIAINGGTLDLNVQQLYAQPITVQGTGVGGNGAIVNNNTAIAPAGTQYDVSNVTLSGNTTIGGTSTPGTTNSGLPGNQYVGRWSLRAQSGVTAVLSTNGNAYTLTKVGNNQIMLVNVTADTALGNVFVNEGVLGLEGTTALGNLSAITVNGTALGQPAGGSILQLRNLTVPLNNNISLQNNGQIYALYTSSDTSTTNTVSGAVTIGSTGGQFNAGGVRDDYAANASAIMTISGNVTGTGSLTCPGPGTVTLTGSTVNFSGNTTVNLGTLQINSPVGATVALHAVSGSGTLGIGNGTVATSVTADSVSVNTLTIGAGATLTITAIPGGPLAGSGSISSVPEPSTWAMLMLAAMGLGIYWRRR